MIDPILIERAELRVITLPLHRPFVTSFGVQRERELVLVRLFTNLGEGWGECPSLAEPVYTHEFTAGALAVLRDHLLPRLAGPIAGPSRVAPALAGVKGHRAAKSALEMAVLDVWLRARSTSLADHLGAERTRVAVGVSIGIHETIPGLLADVEKKIAEGYARIKLKIRPGWDVEPVRAVRKRFGDDVPLQVDANAAYALSDARRLAELDEFGLLLVEQPLAEGDLVQHAELARRLRTPLCLDESIESVHDTAAAIALGSCRIVNIKPGRVGGYLEARRIHDLARANGVAVWCGGLIESGFGRAANLALAGLPGFVLPGDTSPSLHYFPFDVTAPFEMADGHIDVPAGPGLGVEPDPEGLGRATARRETVVVGR
ncbi:o-succinylbenzoate synthase [Jiangella anatolica]|uniref:o-succinylbenzoate synthase n=1 Tax=Jiangella anatolica TaxID=2670374 RepID=A0A2W2C965_9ACTN|nr:o-succinylbenzoate synthase [Jiangella anatolica]PZF82356.1 o-succinylbenzoate synthase [Jiangella anatolica]